MGDGGLGYLGDGDALPAQLGYYAVGLSAAAGVADVDDLEGDAAGAVAGLAGSAAKEVVDGAASTKGEDGRAILDEAPADARDVLAGLEGAVDEDGRVGQKVIARSGEGRAGVVLGAQGLDDEALEEVCAGGEGHGVADGGVEGGDVGLDEVEGLEGGGGGAGLEERDQGLDGGDGLGIVFMLGEDAVVFRDDVEGRGLADGERLFVGEPRRGGGCGDVSFCLLVVRAMRGGRRRNAGREGGSLIRWGSSAVIFAVVRLLSSCARLFFPNWLDGRCWRMGIWQARRVEFQDVTQRQASQRSTTKMWHVTHMLIDVGLAFEAPAPALIVVAGWLRGRRCLGFWRAGALRNGSA